MEKITLNDIGGYHQEKKEVAKIIRFIKQYDELKQKGAALTSGILIYGESGTGKTMFANAIAYESKVPVLKVKKTAANDAKELYTVFEKAISRAPSIVLIDELDQLINCDMFFSGKPSDKEKDFLRCMLTEIDRAAMNGVLTIATTNADFYDIPGSIKRSGRLEKHIKLDPPDIEDREEIINILLKKNPVFEEIDAKELATITNGFMGSDLVTMTNDALYLCLSSNKSKAEMIDFYNAIKSIIIASNSEDIVTHTNDSYIYHEIGKFIANYKLFDKVSTISVENLCDRHNTSLEDPDIDLDFIEHPDRLLDCDCLTYKDYFNYSVFKLSGLAAKEIYYGQKTSGSKNELSDVFKAFCNIVENGLTDNTMLISLKLMANMPMFAIMDYTTLYAETFNKFFIEVYDKAKELLIDSKDLANSLYEQLKLKPTLSVKEIQTIIDSINN